MDNLLKNNEEISQSLNKIIELTKTNNDILTELKQSKNKESITLNNSQPQPGNSTYIPPTLKQITEHIKQGTVSPNHKNSTKNNMDDILIEASNSFPLVTAYWKNNEQLKITAFKHIFDKLAEQLKNKVLFAHINEEGVGINHIEIQFWAKKQMITRSYIKLDGNTIRDYETQMKTMIDNIQKTEKAMIQNKANTGNQQSDEQPHRKHKIQFDESTSQISHVNIPTQYSDLYTHFQAGTVTYSNDIETLTSILKPASKYFPVVTAQCTGKLRDILMTLFPLFAKDHKGQVLFAIINYTRWEENDPKIELDSWDNEQRIDWMYIEKDEYNENKEETKKELDKLTDNVFNKFITRLDLIPRNQHATPKKPDHGHTITADTNWLFNSGWGQGG